MKTIYLRILSAVFIILSLCFAENDGTEEVWNGVNAFYNYNTIDAIEILTQARFDYPENPAVHLTWAAAKWLHNQAANSVNESYTILQRDLDEIIPIYNELVSQYPDNPQYGLFLGSAKGLKARVHLGKKEWLSTLIVAYKGFAIIKDVAHDNPTLIDAQLPIGMVEYYAGISSFLVKWGVSLFGLETTREAGIQKIEDAAQNGDWSWIEATSICAFLYLWVDTDVQKSLNYSTTLIHDFPNNYYFQTLYVESLIRTEQYKLAQNHLLFMQNELDSLTEIQRSWYTAFWSYEMALLAFEEGKLNEAMNYVDASINYYYAELDIVLTNAWLLKGKLHDLKAERQQALKAYKSCIKRDNYTSAIDNARLYSKNPFHL